jgi:ABC-type branched-subunit amino acid transport system permease subunit
MVVGGAGSLWGPIIVTSLFLVVRVIDRPLDAYWPLIAGAVLILIVFFMPKGLVALPEYVPAWYGKLRGLFRRRVPSPG